MTATAMRWESRQLRKLDRTDCAISTIINHGLGDSLSKQSSQSYNSLFDFELKSQKESFFKATLGDAERKSEIMRVRESER